MLISDKADALLEFLMAPERPALVGRVRRARSQERKAHLRCFGRQIGRWTFWMYETNRRVRKMDVRWKLKRASERGRAGGYGGGFGAQYVIGGPFKATTRFRRGPVKSRPPSPWTQIRNHHDYLYSPVTLHTSPGCCWVLLLAWLKGDTRA